MSILFLFSNPNRLPTRLLLVVDSAAYSQLKQLWLHTHHCPESLHLDTRSHQSTTQHYTPTNPVPALICIEYHSEQSLHCVPSTHGWVVSPILFYCRCGTMLFPLFQLPVFLWTWIMAMAGHFHTMGNQTTGKCTIKITLYMAYWI